jgi:hypothetical protein
MGVAQRLPRLAPEMIKHREVRFEPVHSNPDQSGSAADLLRAVEGILELRATDPICLEMEYDLGQICLRDIETALEEVGFHLDNSLLSKLRRTVWHYAEDTQRANLGCHDPRNCARRIFIDCYRHHAHGCRDTRPETLRRTW